MRPYRARSTSAAPSMPRRRIRESAARARARVRALERGASRFSGDPSQLRREGSASDGGATCCAEGEVRAILRGDAYAARPAEDHFGVAIELGPPPSLGVSRSPKEKSYGWTCAK